MRPPKISCGNVAIVCKSLPEPVRPELDFYPTLTYYPQPLTYALSLSVKPGYEADAIVAYFVVVVTQLKTDNATTCVTLPVEKFHAVAMVGFQSGLVMATAYRAKLPEM